MSVMADKDSKIKELEKELQAVQDECAEWEKSSRDAASDIDNLTVHSTLLFCLMEGGVESWEGWANACDGAIIDLGGKPGVDKIQLPDHWYQT